MIANVHSGRQSPGSVLEINDGAPDPIGCCCALIEVRCSIARVEENSVSGTLDKMAGGVKFETERPAKRSKTTEVVMPKTLPFG